MGGPEWGWAGRVQKFKPACGLCKGAKVGGLLRSRVAGGGK